MNLSKYFFKYKWLILILVFALLVKFIYLFITEPPYSWSDSIAFDDIAYNLANGKGYTSLGGNPVAVREPGYIIFILAPIYFLFGHSILMVQIFQIFLSLISVILLYYLVNMVFKNRKVALIATFLFSFHYSSILYPAEVLTETFFQFILLLSVIIFVMAYKNDSWKKFCLAGILFGIATLIRFNAFLIFFALFFPILFSINNAKKALKYISIIFIAIMLVVSPWGIRNYLQFNAFIPGRTGGGHMFWSGSYIPNDGDWISPNKTEKYKNVLKNSPLSYLERDKFFFKEGIQNIKENPLGVAYIWFKKPLKILLKDDLTTKLNNLSHSPKSDRLQSKLPDERFIFPIQIILSIIHLTIIILSIYGGILTYKKDKFLSLTCIFIILYFTVTYIPFNGVPRYIVSLWPFIFLFDAVALNKLWNKFLKP